MVDSLVEGRKIDIQTFDGYWLDIGRPEDYDYANNNFDELSKLLGIL